MIDGIGASLSGMANAQQRLGLTANNIANQQTPGYQALRAENVEVASGGVRIGAITRDPAPGLSLPDSSGMPALEGSNVDPAVEQVNLILNKREFEANLKAFQGQNDTLGYLLDITDPSR